MNEIKNQLLQKCNLVFLFLIPLLIFSCSSGGNSSPTPRYIPAGDYVMSFNNMSCSPPEPIESAWSSDIIINVNSVGQLCPLSSAGIHKSCSSTSPNLSLNPCVYSESSNVTESQVQTNITTLSNCALNPSTNVMTANYKSITSTSGQSAESICTANLTLTPQTP